jgi:hypothetical protein
MPKTPTSRRGTQGVRGRTGKTGKTGPTGAVGPRGVAGPRGPAGPAGPTLNKSDVLAMVEDQFDEIRHELRLQLERMAQIQMQLDQIHSVVKQLLALDQRR